MMQDTLIEFQINGKIVQSVYSVAVPAVGDLVHCTLSGADSFCGTVTKRHWVLDRDQRRHGVELNVVLWLDPIEGDGGLLR